jgi:predicted DNA-binding protein (UPF0251 family)/predicted Fe-Mo cluster-binding NifX family protein
MPRESKCRRVAFLPPVKAFNPVGIPLAKMEEVVFKVEEIEAIRLKNHLNLEQEECALMMEVSRPTFQRILTEAYGKVADAFTNGKAIRIEGGSYCLGEGHCRRRERHLDYMEGCRYYDSGLEINRDARNEINQRRVAVCAEGSDPAGLMNERFGRCTCLGIWDSDSNTFSFMDILPSNQENGQGTNVAKMLVQTGVSELIVNRIGPKAFLILKRANIRIYQGENSKTIAEVIQMYQNQQLYELESANA